MSGGGPRAEIAQYKSEECVGPKAPYFFKHLYCTVSAPRHPPDTIFPQFQYIFILIYLLAYLGEWTTTRPDLALGSRHRVKGERWLSAGMNLATCKHLAHLGTHLRAWHNKLCTLNYAIVLPGRKSDFRNGFRLDPNRESLQIGPPGGLRPTRGPFSRLS